MIMKSFIFTIKLRGFGDTPEEAIADLKAQGERNVNTF